MIQWLHQFIAPRDVVLNWEYHLQLDIDINESLAKSFLEVASNLTVSIPS